MKDKIELNSDAVLLRNRMGKDSSSFIDVFSIINQMEHTTLVLYPMPKNISGMCIKIKSIENLIAINSSLSYGRQRYSVAHELYHVSFQKGFSYIVCAKEIGGTTKNEEEINADMFASYFLAPYEAFKLFITEKLKKSNQNPFSINDVVKIEQNFQMSRQATVYRLINEGYITQAFAETLKNNVIQSAIKLGYDESLYVPTPKEKQYFTSGNYINLVEDVRQKGLISLGKYEELFLEAYRNDIVYGLSGGCEETYD